MPAKQDDKKTDGKTPATAPGNTDLVAQQVFVTTGPTRGDQVAVLSGIHQGDNVVTSGQLKLKNGTPVVIDNRIAPSNNSDPKPREE